MANSASERLLLGHHTYIGCPIQSSKLLDCGFLSLDGLQRHNLLLLLHPPRHILHMILPLYLSLLESSAMVQRNSGIIQCRHERSEPQGIAHHQAEASIGAHGHALTWLCVIDCSMTERGACLDVPLALRLGAGHQVPSAARGSSCGESCPGRSSKAGLSPPVRTKQASKGLQVAGSKRYGGLNTQAP